MNTASLNQSATASQRNVSQYATVEQIELVMGLPSGSISPIAWLLIQEESKGVKHEDVAKKLGVEIEDLTRLVDATTGCEGVESKEIWAKGIVGIRAVTIVNEQNIGSGWDAIEAIAVDKIARNLQAMRTSGDLSTMMQLAQMANKAVRRDKGEGNGGRGGVNIGINAPGADIALSSGKLGRIQLNLSPAIQKQLSSPNRIIDAVRNKENEVRTLNNLEMMNLKDTRKLADSVADIDVEVDEYELKEDPRYNGMTFTIDVDSPKSESE